MEGTDQKVIQLETAVASAICNFSRAVGINVPRSRFLPVKSTSDLFLVQSDLYTLAHGRLIMTPLTLSKRPFNTIPTIKLGEHFRKVKSYLERVGKGVPSLIECDHLTVSGDVTFGSNVVLKVRFSFIIVYSTADLASYRGPLSL
jgi:UTP--glucose-1-phosphate uridylyltransferase